MPINIRQATINELEKIAAFAFKTNKKINRCLHTSETQEGIIQQLQQLDPIWSQQSFIASKSDEIDILAIFDCDIKKGQGWAHGPFFDMSVPAKDVVDFYVEALTHLPTEIKKMTHYVTSTSISLMHVLELVGYDRRSKKNAVYTLEATNRPDPPVQTHPISNQTDPDEKKQLEHIHNHHFPESYLTVSEMIEKSAQGDFCLLTLKIDGSIIGYGFASGDNGDSEGFIDYIAVDTPFHRQGFGRALVHGLLKWIFEEKNYQQAALSVGADNLSAMTLYQSMGFTLKYQGVGLDKSFA